MSKENIEKWVEIFKSYGSIILKSNHEIYAYNEKSLEILISQIIADTERVIFEEMAEEFDTNENEDYRAWQYANDRLTPPPQETEGDKKESV